MNFFSNKLQIDILKRHVGPFIFCFLTVMFLLLMQFLILYIDKLIGKGLPLSVIIELILTNLAYMVVLAAPMAVLVASLIAFGKFTELNELTALRAAGVNPIHIINPVLLASALLTVFLFWFSNDVLPNSNQRALSLFIDIRLKKPGFDLKQNEFYYGIKGYTFLVKNITNNSDSLRNITLFQEPSTHRHRAYIRAKRGYLKSTDRQTLTLFLYDGSITRYLNRQKHGKNSLVVEHTDFHRYRISFDISNLEFKRSNPNHHAHNDRTMDIQSMKAVVDTLKHKNKIEEKRVFETNNLLPYLKKKAHHSDHHNNTASENHAAKLDSTNMPYKSEFYMLNQEKTRRAQQELYQMALSRLRTYHSTYQNMLVNNNWRSNRITEYWVEIYKKFSIPLACLIFVLIGAPIGMYTKKGNLGTAALISTGFLTFYWISLIQGEKLADRGYISAFTGMWGSDIFLAVIGGFLVFQLCTSFKISNLWKRDD